MSLRNINVIAVSVIGKSVFDTVNCQRLADIIGHIVAAESNFATGIIRRNQIQIIAAETGQRRLEIVNQLINGFHGSVHGLDFNIKQIVVGHKVLGHVQRCFQADDVKCGCAVAGISRRFETGRCLKAVQIKLLFVLKACVEQVNITCISRNSHNSASYLTMSSSKSKISFEAVNAWAQAA